MNLHRALIANEIFCDGESGGGGSSDFSTAEVVVTNNSSEGFSMRVASVFDENEISVDGATFSPSEYGTVTVILYKGSASYYLEGEISTVSIALTGDIEPSFMGNMFGIVHGNGTITITST